MLSTSFLVKTHDPHSLLFKNNVFFFIFFIFYFFIHATSHTAGAKVLSSSAGNLSKYITWNLPGVRNAINISLYNPPTLGILLPPFSTYSRSRYILIFRHCTFLFIDDLSSSRAPLSKSVVSRRREWGARRDDRTRWRDAIRDRGMNQKLVRNRRIMYIEPDTRKTSSLPSSPLLRNVRFLHLQYPNFGRSMWWERRTPSFAFPLHCWCSIVTKTLPLYSHQAGSTCPRQNIDICISPVDSCYLRRRGPLSRRDLSRESGPSM